ncbi:GntT/GntP/DsdX family permease [Cupriavidus basilensis]
MIALVVLIAKFKLNPFITPGCRIGAARLCRGHADGRHRHNLRRPAWAGTLAPHRAGRGPGHQMLGKMMAESGGAERIARTLIDAFGEKNAALGPWSPSPLSSACRCSSKWASCCWMPIAFNVAKRTGTSMVLVGIPMCGRPVGGAPGLIPLHPAALLAVTAYKADIGKTIMYALIVGIPTARHRRPRCSARS